MSFPTFYRCFRSLLIYNHKSVIIRKINVYKFRVNSSLLQQSNFKRFTSNAHKNNKDVLTSNTINNLTEENSYLKAQNNPDIFGDQTSSYNITEDIIDDGDLQEESYIQNPPSKSHKLRTKEYADIIKDHLKNNRIKEAIDVIENRMIKEDRVKPENYIYNLVIGGCARVGYSKKAFQLYNKMKQRDLKVTGGTYTSLFNACANSPWKEDNLQKANRLREIMVEKGYEPNASNYNAMIKAYGRCEDIKTCFSLVDEMIEKRVEVYIDSINFLLQACASDREYGFRHAVLIWNKMMNKNLKPDIYSFNLILRCTRDCGIGDTESTNQLFEQMVGTDSNVPLIQNSEQQYLSVRDIKPNSVNVVAMINETSGQSINSHETNISPNLLSQKPHLGSLISISEIKKPEERLLLLGGMSGFLNEMERYKVSPNIKTFTELLEIIPSTRAAEKNLISYIRKIGVKADIDFFNILIKKRSMRFDYESAREVLSMIKAAKLCPDIVTYGVLALGCQTSEEAIDFIAEIRSKGVRLNVQILGSMLRQGCAKQNFAYILEIMDITKTENIKPNIQYIKHLYNFERMCVNIIKSKKGTDEISSRTFAKKFKLFSNKWEELKNELNIKNKKFEEAVKVLQTHPWEQFKKEQPQGFEKVKNEKQRHDKKLQRYIRRINPDKLLNDPLDTAQNVIEK